MDYIKYIPNEMKGIKEYNELDKAVNPTISSVKSDMISISNNHYLSLLDEYGCDRMEKIMGIEGNEQLALEMRRLYIITKANMKSCHTISHISSQRS